MYAEDGANRPDARIREPWSGIERMPPPGHDSRQRRVEAVEPGWRQLGTASVGVVTWLRPEAASHQTSSIIAVLRPDPTPINSTRSPLLSRSASSASVIGMDAGPTLPYFG